MSLLAISPLDGRYTDKMATLAPLVSEYGLIKARLEVEIIWFKALAAENNIPELPTLSEAAKQFLLDTILEFTPREAEKVKVFEKTTNHDVKALEYYLKDKFAAHPELAPHCEFIHFACTSEDINNCAYALMTKQARDECLLPALKSLIATLREQAALYATVPMLARTHGQPASPTTMGKELMNVVRRLDKAYDQVAQTAILAKMNGAVGNFNAHCIAYPEVDWLSLSESFVTELGLVWNSHTTQIEPHDYIAELFHAIARINTILLDFARDVWGYISLGYFIQKTIATEVGSSTMPHKINPIDFENAEGNLGLANAIGQHLANKLPISRWQRDLSDSTVLRNIGVVFGHCLLAYHSLQNGLKKLSINEVKLRTELAEHSEVLAEAVQTVMRRYQIPKPYEKLKALTRGQILTQESLQNFIAALDLPETAKQTLLALTPETYIGLATRLSQEGS